MEGSTTLEQQRLHHPCPSQKPILTSSLLNMETGEGHEGSYVLGHSHTIFRFIPLLHLPNNTILFIDHKPCPNISSNSNNMNDCGEGTGASDERKRKRMFSNRGSARRSRMRKKQQIENLQYQVDHLQTMNHQLSQKSIYLLESNQQVLQQTVSSNRKFLHFKWPYLTCWLLCLVMKKLITSPVPSLPSLCSTSC